MSLQEFSSAIKTRGCSAYGERMKKKTFNSQMSLKNLTLDIRLKHPNSKSSKEFNSSLKLTTVSKVIKFIYYYANI